MADSRIPAPRTPFIDERTGLISREWFLYLLNRIGSDSLDDAVNNILQAPVGDDCFSTINRAVESLNGGPIFQDYQYLDRRIDDLAQMPTQQVIGGAAEGLHKTIVTLNKTQIVAINPSGQEIIAAGGSGVIRTPLLTTIEVKSTDPWNFVGNGTFLTNGYEFADIDILNLLTQGTNAHQVIWWPSGQSVYTASMGNLAWTIVSPTDAITPDGILNDADTMRITSWYVESTAYY